MGGYTRVIQYGNYTEVYQYDKKHNSDRRPRNLSPVQKKRKQDRAKTNKFRLKRSVYRARQAFFRLVHHNNVHSKTVTFCTLTFAYEISYEKSLQQVARFFQNVKKRYPEERDLAYISVSEKTKKGRYHYHILIYNLSTKIVREERDTRNIQRQFNAGYVDLRIATYISEGLAGYMAKYMAKTLADSHVSSRRGYNCSRNIKKPSSVGSNTLFDYENYYLGENDYLFKDSEYDTMYLGRCRFKHYIKRA